MKYAAIGGSAGSNEILREIYSHFKVGFSGAVIICQHVLPTLQGSLRNSFVYGTPHKVKEAEEKESLASGITYLAPGGYHLLIEKDATFSFNVDDPVCYARPSIDVMFETAAKAFGKNLLGILLSGSNSDGAEGLCTIKKWGGTTIAQDPTTAPYPEMPERAIKRLVPDYIMAPDEIAKFITKHLSGDESAI